MGEATSVGDGIMTGEGPCGEAGGATEEVAEEEGVGCGCACV